jgi:hypothetical protein
MKPFSMSCSAGLQAYYTRRKTGLRYRARGRPSHRKNSSTSAAGTNTPHHPSSPRALIAFGPSFTTINMMAPAHAKALIKLSVVKRRGRTPAYAQAIGIAVRDHRKRRAANQI